MTYLKPVPGLCDGCGLRYPLKDLKFEYYMGRNTGLRKCRYCYDPSHPQLETRNIQTSDKQNVKDSRSDNIEWEASRKMYAWNPVGTPLTSTLNIAIGRVKVMTP